MIYLQDIPGKIAGVGDLEGDLLSQGGDGGTVLDLAGPVAAGIATGSHDDDLLEERDINHVHLADNGGVAVGAVGGELHDSLLDCRK